MDSVAVIVVRIARPSACVDSMHIINVPITIVINSVSGNFTRIRPHVRSEILVSVTDASINHGHDYVVGGSLSVPAFRTANVGIRRAAVLADVVEVPQRSVRVPGVVWIRDCELANIVRLGVPDLTAVLKLGDCLRNGCSGGQLNDLNIFDLRVAPQNARPELRMKSGDARDRRLYQNAVLAVKVGLRLNLGD